ncbi:TA system VapC family ribonuclease toxin [Granulicella sp. 5B5]|uniref:TA system VapC family ribonuclease toxin n=1 Tax=Granulicella sp. 5B5 TaxID=1617967 RepID=UPI0015F5212D|nr:TA system VapC family ribonuclease toxin [Granulicella sp. 5B5]
MIAPDTNLLLYAHNYNSPFYSEARAYWQDALHGVESIGIPVICLHAFIRISTGAAFGASRLSIQQAIAFADGWLKYPHVQVLYPGRDHWGILQKLAVQANALGQIFTDAAIAAIAIEHNAVVHTNDSDFARFSDLRWHNPFQP